MIPSWNRIEIWVKGDTSFLLGVKGLTNIRSFGRRKDCSNIIMYSIFIEVLAFFFSVRKRFVFWSTAFFLPLFLCLILVHCYFPVSEHFNFFSSANAFYLLFLQKLKAPENGGNSHQFKKCSRKRSICLTWYFVAISQAIHTYLYTCTHVFFCNNCIFNINILFQEEYWFSMNIFVICIASSILTF